jgi:hypothetical protein
MARQTIKINFVPGNPIPSNDLNNIGKNLLYILDENTLFKGSKKFTLGNISVGDNDNKAVFHVGADATAMSAFGDVGSMLLASTGPSYILYETDADIDEHIWFIGASAGRQVFRAVKDDISATTDWLIAERTGITIDRVLFPNGRVSIGDNDNKTFFQVGADAPAMADFGDIGAIMSASTSPSFIHYESDAAVNEHLWIDGVSSGKKVFRAVSDDLATINNWMEVDRTGAVIDKVIFPNGRVTIGENDNKAVFHVGADATAMASFGDIGSMLLSSTSPNYILYESDAASDEHVWFMGASGGDAVFRAVNDALSVTTDWLKVERTGTTIDFVRFPNGNVVIQNALQTNVIAAESGDFININSQINPTTSPVESATVTLNINGSTALIPRGTYYIESTVSATLGTSSLTLEKFINGAWRTIASNSATSMTAEAMMGGLESSTGTNLRIRLTITSGSGAASAVLSKT